MNGKEAKALVSTELKNYQLIRRNELRGCFLNGSVLCLGIISGVVATATVAIPASTPETMLLKGGFGIVTVVGCGCLTSGLNQLINHKGMQTPLAISILKGIRRELNHGVNRFESVEVPEFNSELGKLLSYFNDKV